MHLIDLCVCVAGKNCAMWLPVEQSSTTLSRVGVDLRHTYGHTQNKSPNSDELYWVTTHNLWSKKLHIREYLQKASRLSNFSYVIGTKIWLCGNIAIVDGNEVSHHQEILHHQECCNGVQCPWFKQCVVFAWIMGIELLCGILPIREAFWDECNWVLLD